MDYIAPTDWNELEELAKAVGLPPDRVGVVRQRLQHAGARAGAPYTLLVGPPEGWFDRLLESWLGKSAAERARASGDLPLVVGPNPQQMLPPHSNWPIWQKNLDLEGHLLVWRRPTGGPSDVFAELAGLGYLDQLVLATRLGELLPPSERALARAGASWAATGRVLVVGLPGEAEAMVDSERGEIATYVAEHMRHAGFDGGRYLGVEFWIVGKGSSAATRELSARLGVDREAVAAGWSAMARRAIHDLLAAVYQASRANPTVRAAPIEAAEKRRLLQELEQYLAALREQVAAWADRRSAVTAPAVRAYALDIVSGWRARMSIEGHWLHYVDTRCPGFEAAFIEETRAALEALDYQPMPAAAPSQRSGGGPALLDRAFSWAVHVGIGAVHVDIGAVHVGIGLMCGVIIYLGFPRLFEAVGDRQDPLVDLLRLLSSAVAAVVGGGIACRLWPGPQTGPQPAPAALSSGSLTGWDQVEARVLRGVADRLDATGAAPAERCRRLAARLGIHDLETP